MDSKTWMMNGRIKYLRIKKSLSDCKDSSPELQNAIEAFCEMDKGLKDIQCQEGDMFQISVISALLNYEMGLILNRMENSKKAKNHFSKSKDLICDHAMKEECITLIINVFLQLGKLWSSTNEHSRTWDTFRTAFELFKQYKETKNLPPITAMEDLFLQAHERKIKRSDAAMISLVNPMRIKGIELFLSSDFTDFISSEFGKTLNEENFDFLLNVTIRSCHIAGYLTSGGYFQFARYILACANKIATDGENKFKHLEQSSLKRQKLNCLKSFIYSVQFTYATFLLEISKEALEPENSDGFIARFSKLCKHSENELLRTDEMKKYKDEIPCEFATNFEDALQIFQFGLQSLQLLENCSMGGETSREKISRIINHSDLYTKLLKFVEDPDVECEINLKRIQLLETALAGVIVKECPKEYQEAVLKIGAIYHNMLNVACNELTDDETELTDENISRIDSLASKAVLFYEKHISIFSCKNGEIPGRFLNKLAPNLSIGLQGIFGKVYVLISAHSETIENLNTAVKYLKLVLDYITENPDQKLFLQSAVTEEYENLTEMLCNLQCRGNTRNI